MGDLELVLNMLAEVSTKEISENENPSTFDESNDIANEGGATEKVAKERIEKKLGRKVVTAKNAKELHFKDEKGLISANRNFLSELLYTISHSLLPWSNN